MLHSAVLLILVLHLHSIKSEIQSTSSENRNFSEDEETDDLEAEVFAYSAALNVLEGDERRSMGSTPCWRLGGICVNHRLCKGSRSLSQVPGCKNKLNVCCFTWNRTFIKDMRDHGIGTLGFPWSLKREFGGKGVLVKSSAEHVKRKKKKKLNKGIQKLSGPSRLEFKIISDSDEKKQQAS